MDAIEISHSDMHISEVRIINFKAYKDFSLILNAGKNILVGNNEAGKSTILQAIHLVLTGTLHGRAIKNLLSQYLFNKVVEAEYIKSLSTEQRLPAPYILIELVLSGNTVPELAILRGTNNSTKRNLSGISLRIEFDEQYINEYEQLIKKGDVRTIPIEYYTVTWRSFVSFR